MFTSQPKKIYPLFVVLIFPYACSESNFKSSSDRTGVTTKTQENTDGNLNPISTSNPTASTPISTNDSSAEILAKCVSGTKKLKTLKVDFAADTNMCEWGVNGNLGRKDKVITAMEAQYQQFAADEDALAICGLSIAALTPDFIIDDEAIFTLSKDDSSLDYMLYSDWFPMKSFSEMSMQKSNEVVIFERTKIIGFNYAAAGYNAPIPECAFGVTCSGIKRQQSRSGVVGVLDFKMTPEFLKNLPADFLLAKKFKLALWASGNKNDTDCTHTALSFDVQIEYLAK